MTIKEFLHSLNYSSGDIKQRMNNNQISISGEIIKDLNLTLNNEYYLSLEEWLCCHNLSFLRKLDNLKILFNKFEDMFEETNINNPILKYLNAFKLLKIDKKTYYIFLK